MAVGLKGHVAGMTDDDLRAVHADDLPGVGGYTSPWAPQGPTVPPPPPVQPRAVFPNAQPQAQLAAKTGVPGAASGVVATQEAVVEQGRVFSLVTVSFTAPASDFSGANIWVTGYKSNSNWQLMASCDVSPAQFVLEQTGETVGVYVQPFGDGGSNADPLSVSAHVALSGNGAPPAPTISQTLTATPTGFQFTIAQEGGLLSDVVTGYNVYRNTVNNPATATKIAHLAQDPTNSGGLVFSDVQPASSSLYYWVTAVNTQGVESTFVAAQTGAVTTISPLTAAGGIATGTKVGDTYPVKAVGDNQKLNLDTETQDGTSYVRMLATRASDNVPYTYRGVWSSADTYLQGDEVVYGASYWLSLATNTNSAPGTGNSNWQVVGTYSGFEGAWSSATAYVPGAEVAYAGNFWVCLVANTNSAPTVVNTNWQVAGPASLDAVPDGTSYAKTLATGLLDGYAVQTKNGVTVYSVKGVGDAQTLSLGSEIEDAGGYVRGVDRASTETVDNADFEASATSVPGWQVFGTATLNVNTSSPYSGTQFAKLTGCAAGAGMRSTRKYPVTPGDSWTVACALKAFDASAVPALWFEFFDGSGTAVGHTPVVTQSLTSWVAVTSSGTVPAGAVYGQIQAGNQGAASGNVGVDAVRLTRIRAIDSETSGVLPQDRHDPTVLLSTINGLQVNMVPDSDIKYPTAFWGANNGGLVLTHGLGSGQNLWAYIGTGAVDPVPQQQFTQLFSVVPGQTYTFSIYMDAIAGYATGSDLPRGSWFENGIEVTNVAAPSGQSGRFSVTRTVPAGVTQVRLMANMGATKNVPAGHAIYIGAFQFEAGAAMTAYRSNALDSATGFIPHDAMSDAVRAAIEALDGDGKANLSADTKALIALTELEAASLIADNLAETATRKWAGESGADVTAGKPLGSLSGLLTSILTDDASLGQTAHWSGVSGSGKPADNADVTSANPQAMSWLTDHTNIVKDGDSLTRLVDLLASVITYTGGATVDSLKPGEAAADKTLNHTSISSAAGSTVSPVIGSSWAQVPEMSVSTTANTGSGFTTVTFEGNLIADVAGYGYLSVYVDGVQDAASITQAYFDLTPVQAGGSFAGTQFSLTYSKQLSAGTHTIAIYAKVSNTGGTVPFQWLQTYRRLQVLTVS